MALTEKLKFHNVLAICSKVKSSLTRLAVGFHFWDSAGCGAWGYRPSRHVIPRCLHWLPPSPGCLSPCPWKQSRYSGTESRQTQPSYLLGNRERLGLELSSSAWQEMKQRFGRTERSSSLSTAHSSGFFFFPGKWGRLKGLQVNSKAPVCSLERIDYHFMSGLSSNYH